jgi:linoleate 9S-lipoxygenase
LQGKHGNPAYLENWISTITPLIAGESAFKVTFEWDEEEIGIPGAFLIRNNHHSEFYLKSLTLQDVPGHGRIHFVCNSWVYPADKYKNDRVFFSNKVIPKFGIHIFASKLTSWPCIHIFADISSK